MAVWESCRTTDLVGKEQGKALSVANAMAMYLYTEKEQSALQLAFDLCVFHVSFSSQHTHLITQIAIRLSHSCFIARS